MNPEPARFKDVPCPYCKERNKVRNNEWLRWARKKAGISLNQWARKLRYSSAYISDIELGRRRCTEEIASEYIHMNLGGKDEKPTRVSRRAS